MSCEPSNNFPHNFWLSPDGKAYECLAYEHYELADKLCLQLYGHDSVNTEEFLEKRGWIKRSLGDFIYLANNLIRVGGPTQAQIDYIFAYHKYHNTPMNSYVMDLIDLQNRN